MAYEKFSIPIQKETWSTSIEYAIQRLCTDHKFTFLYLEFSDSFTDRLKEIGCCRIKKVPFPILPSWLAIQLRHGSPYGQIFNRM